MERVYLLGLQNSISDAIVAMGSPPGEERLKDEFGRDSGSYAQGSNHSYVGICSIDVGMGGEWEADMLLGM
jgi:hypothetical protein